ncbi:hypothetical protein [Peribacillus sp. ACCC06369]|uniref:hypothetical protein n=1 Tax=Peribacillus sp. ACCC06369 TaxID=3055860 RepID=UPI0025A216F9|nr:hypothetical protein [Peribacillus sp. ACCC06369]MDM5360537.1 hypothetical protein [Peribacillus sp. ACCC06369]
MKLIIGYYILQIIIVILCILLGYFIYDKRINRNHGVKVPDGFQSTDEINIDPVTGEKTRVYYNPDTGERFYKKEK